MTRDGKSHPPLVVCILQALLLFLAVSAIFPGMLLVADPTGTLLEMPLEMLRHSPFPDFLIPGLFLLFVLGIIPLITFFGLLKRFPFKPAECVNVDKGQHWSHTLSFYVGIVLVLWIDFQVMFIQSIHILHLIFSLLGVVIVVLSQMPSVREYYRK